MNKTITSIVNKQFKKLLSQDKDIFLIGQGLLDFFYVGDMTE
ncbi:MAG: hypothetical protein WCJ39_10340 [bacterium]